MQNLQHFSHITIRSKYPKKGQVNYKKRYFEFEIANNKKYEVDNI